MVTPESIKTHIETTLPCDLVHVEGDDGHHFSAIIVSAEFRDKNMVQQHQLVYHALGKKNGARDSCAVYENADTGTVGRKQPKLILALFTQPRLGIESIIRYSYINNAAT